MNEVGKAFLKETIHSMLRRCEGWDYSQPCIYMITAVLANRRSQTLGSVIADSIGDYSPRDNSPRDTIPPASAHCELTELGRAVEDCWEAIPRFYPQVQIIAKQVMPDHFHGIVQVEEPIDTNIGRIIRDFKAVCTKQYRILYPPILADGIDSEYLARSSRKQREEYYAEHGIEPLFDDNYDDTICYRKGQLKNIIQYVKDNPRRAIMRAMCPDLFQRRQHISSNGQDYAAYGNLFLLKHPWKEQVFCHRWKMIDGHRDYDTRYETTDEFLKERETWIQAAKDGAVLVTPGISKGEQQLVKDCIEQALPLIQIQKEPIANGWNPERRRHQMCEMGQLLILSPWQLSEMNDVDGVPADTDYSQFHNMNVLAARICSNEIRQDWRIKNI